jgi:hypothetical protein
VNALAENMKTGLFKRSYGSQMVHAGDLRQNLFLPLALA